MKNIAIVGAGFAGLAAAWHLLQQFHDAGEPVRTVIFDDKGIGGGASGIAAGLLHPFAGLHCKLNRQGHEGWEATCKLLKASASALKDKVADHSGLLRPALNNTQIEDFSLCAKQHPEVKWLDVQELSKLAPGIAPASGILITSGITVYAGKYLQGLWKSCELRGAEFEPKAVGSLRDLRHFDVSIIASGAAVKSFPELAHLPITPVKGQILEFAWPEGLEPLGLALNSQAYVVMHPDKMSCLAGSTFERGFTSIDPDPARACGEIIPKLLAFYPPLKEAKILDCKAGIRASTPDHYPILKRFGERGWVLTGLGSKGLLYHALFAESLARQVRLSI